MSWDPIWDSVFVEHEWGKYPDESFIRFAAWNYYRCPDRKSVKILEVGCGPGANIWYLAKEGFSAYGIDGAAIAIDRAKARLSAENLSADLKVGDIVNLPYADGIFDAVADNACITHNSFSDARKILKEVSRVLKPGGLFYSRIFANDVYLGKTKVELSPNAYNSISDGPFAGRGFIRVANEEDARRLYGEFFKIKSLDYRKYSINDKAVLISEIVINAEK